MDLENQLATQLQASGAQFRVVGIDKIARLKAVVAANQSAHTGSTAYNRYADESYDFSVLDNPAIKSVFITATPSPIYVLRLADGRVLRIPPIYGNRAKVVAASRALTPTVFEPAGYRTWPVFLPKKLTAAHCGLASYGNNGLTYIKGWGSYFRLTMFASDYAAESEAPWQSPELLKSCERCGRCVAACPAAALTKGSPWVDTNRCLTAFNERPGEFPAWLGAEAHNCLVGCLKCQEVCPHNHKKAREVVVDVAADFGAELAAAAAYAELSPATRALLEEHSLDRYFRVLQRNLAALHA